MKYMTTSVTFHSELLALRKTVSFVFLRISMFSEPRSRETTRCEESKTNCLPRQGIIVFFCYVT